MRIAVIGTGNVGSALGGSLARAGRQVTFAARDAARAAEVAAAAGASSAATPAEARRGRRRRRPRGPLRVGRRVAAEIAPFTAGKVVIDTTNPLRADFSGLATDDGPSGAETIAAALPGALVVKAFNTLFAGVQGNPGALGTTLDALYATDDDAAARTVADLASSIGFRPIRSARSRPPRSSRRWPGSTSGCRS